MQVVMPTLSTNVALHGSSLDTNRVALPYAPAGRIFAAGGWDGRLRVFHGRKLKPLAVLSYHRAAIAAVAFSPDGRLIASGSRDGSVALWDIYPPK